MPDRDQRMRFALDALTAAETALQEAASQQPLSAAEPDATLRRLEDVVAVVCADPAPKTAPPLH